MLFRPRLEQTKQQQQQQQQQRCNHELTKNEEYIKRHECQFTWPFEVPVSLSLNLWLHETE